MNGYRWPAIVTALSGCLLLATQPASVGGGLSLVAPFGSDYYSGMPRAAAVVVVFPQVAAVVVALLLVRWWPWQLLAAGLLTAGTTLHVVPLPILAVPLTLSFTLIGVLAGAQGLIRDGVPRWGTAIAVVALGLRLFSAGLIGRGTMRHHDHQLFQATVVAVALFGVLAFAWRVRPGERGPRARPVIVAAATLFLVIPLSMVTRGQVAALLGIDSSVLFRHPWVENALAGGASLVLAAGLAAAAGLWSLGAALTMALAQAALGTPLLLAFFALEGQTAARWSGLLAGTAIGVLAAITRWRVAAAGTLSVLAATSLFIAYSATTGDPGRIGTQHRVVPALIILVVVVAAVTATAGATVPVLARRGSVPAMLGPVAGMMAASAALLLQATYLEGDGRPASDTLNAARHLNTSGVLLLVAGAAVGGLGLAHYLTERWAERKRAEEIRREAAAAERDRLARPIHDGVLQVLAMVQRQGAEPAAAGTALADLATLAGEQESALRRLLAGGGTLVPPVSRADGVDLRAALSELAGPGVEVATPAEAVPLPGDDGRELIAAVRAALDNVRRHAGPGAHAWLLLEDEGDGVRVTVRDDGAGIAPGRLAEAERDGRLGVAQSMRGRVADLGGTMTVDSRPGEGTEVEFWLPRRR
ncbi:signal transduction histidine kinase [Actinoplanes octamycinicus]|uniref:Signal transduction histidine kinase n=1 Tax=Actinoplanes octamycinicus TaxID=135948 RepID=A0A7W7M7W4_9ACTN|nr:ATP-binding protein [Actinoplanes octamycinicus]MBB4740253.1 signal transduction histidine kinase [Actinoplanes octamycinicus]